MKEREQYHKKKPDVKEKMTTLLIQHQLLNDEDLESFHQEIQTIVDKYYPLYQKGLVEWFKVNRTESKKELREEEKEIIDFIE